jgi:hypothetical protein
MQNPTTIPSGVLKTAVRKEKEKLTKNSGHLRLCQQPRAAHALRSDQYQK